MESLAGIYLRYKNGGLASVYELDPECFEVSLGDDDGVEQHFLMPVKAVREWIDDGIWERIDEEAV